jgi:hypothetical protein
MELSALQRRFAHSFRRSGETEMEQLFQMATDRAAVRRSDIVIAES